MATRRLAYMVGVTPDQTGIRGGSRRVGATCGTSSNVPAPGGHSFGVAIAGEGVNRYSGPPSGRGGMAAMIPQPYSVTPQGTDRSDPLATPAASDHRQSLPDLLAAMISGPDNSHSMRESLPMAPFSAAPHEVTAS